MGNFPPAQSQEETAVLFFITVFNVLFNLCVLLLFTLLPKVCAFLLFSLFPLGCRRQHSCISVHKLLHFKDNTVAYEPPSLWARLFFLSRPPVTNQRLLIPQMPVCFSWFFLFPVSCFKPGQRRQVWPTFSSSCCGSCSSCTSPAPAHTHSCCTLAWAALNGYSTVKLPHSKISIRLKWEWRSLKFSKGWETEVKLWSSEVWNLMPLLDSHACFPSDRGWNLPGHLPGFYPHGLQRSREAEPLPAVRSTETLTRSARSHRRRLWDPWETEERLASASRLERCRVWCGPELLCVSLNLKCSCENSISSGEPLRRRAHLFCVQAGVPYINGTESKP